MLNRKIKRDVLSVASATTHTRFSIISQNLHVFCIFIVKFEWIDNRMKIAGCTFILISYTISINKYIVKYMLKLCAINFLTVLTWLTRMLRKTALYLFRLMFFYTCCFFVSRRSKDKYSYLYIIHWNHTWKIELLQSWLNAYLFDVKSVVKYIHKANISALIYNKKCCEHQSVSSVSFLL